MGGGEGGGRLEGDEGSHEGSSLPAAAAADSRARAKHTGGPRRIRLCRFARGEI